MAFHKGDKVKLSSTYFRTMAGVHERLKGRVGFIEHEPHDPRNGPIGVRWPNTKGSCYYAASFLRKVK